MEKASVISVLPIVPWTHRINKTSELEREPKNQSVIYVGTIPDPRRQPRFKIEVDIRINSRTCGVLKGRTVDISESGIAAMLPIEAPLDENVELNLTIKRSTVTIQAIARQKNIFSYGFEFVDSDSIHEIIRRTCRDLAIEQSPTSTDLG